MVKKLFQLAVLTSAALVMCVLPVSGQTAKDLPELASVERELKGGETHSYRVSLPAGKFIHAIVEQKEIDLIAAAFAPDDTKLTNSDKPHDICGSESFKVVAS